MIITHLTGGLGNQMYQYAMGRHIAELNSTVLKLDITEFERYKLRHYQLHCFNIQEHFATVEEIYALKRKRWFKESETLASIKRKLGFFPASSKRFFLNGIVIKEKPFYYEPEILDLRGNIYLEGYWESYQYYEPLRDLLLKEFSVKYPLNSHSLDISKRISATRSVSLHIRRGDKANDPKTNKVHGLCSVEYYRKAMNYFREHFSDVHFYVFSDDIIWAKDNFSDKTGSITFVSHNDTSTAYEDLRLMALCEHNIIANSSFSIWGAFLNQNPQKIVIAPKRFVTVEEEQRREKLIASPERRIAYIPEDWIRM